MCAGGRLGHTSTSIANCPYGVSLVSAPLRGATPGFGKGDLVCRLGNKRCYFSWQEAGEVREHQEAVTGTPLRVYRCDVCGYLHLTKKAGK